MSDFTASNGIKVENFTHFSGLHRIIVEKNAKREIDVAVTADVIKALVEALDHERDEEFGRWRPDNPSDYYAMPQADGSVRVVDERSGISEVLYRPGDKRNPALATAGGSATAHAYFKAHPEREPWEDARDGEIWEFGDGPHSVQCLVDGHRFFRLPLVSPDSPSWRPAYFASDLEDGRRIWPEEDAS